jgi:serine/threonine protein kinase
LNESLILVMEFIEGESLEKKLLKRNVSRTTGIDYICQTLSALEYAHDRGVVHRDVTPSNLIIDQNGAVKLTDFGVAKSLGDYQLTNAGEIVGSLYYMAPEQVRRHSDPDPRSDIYSVGAVLYEVLTGKKLFASADRLSLKVAQVRAMLIDIYMDGFSLHWRSAPLRRTVNYRVGLFVRVPERIRGRARQLTRPRSTTWFWTPIRRRYNAE